MQNRPHDTKQSRPVGGQAAAGEGGRIKSLASHLNISQPVKTSDFTDWEGRMRIGTQAAWCGVHTGDWRAIAVVGSIFADLSEIMRRAQI